MNFQVIGMETVTVARSDNFSEEGSLIVCCVLLPVTGAATFGSREPLFYLETGGKKPKLAWFVLYTICKGFAAQASCLFCLLGLQFHQRAGCSTQPTYTVLKYKRSFTLSENFPLKCRMLGN